MKLLKSLNRILWQLNKKISQNKQTNIEKILYMLLVIKYN